MCPRFRAGDVAQLANLTLVAKTTAGIPFRFEASICLPRLLRSLPFGMAMCEKCSQIDKQLAHYRELSGWAMDKQALDSIERLIGKLEVEKQTLHPGHQK